ncbi:hypothetical protein [Microbacterium aurum]
MPMGEAERPTAGDRRGFHATGANEACGAGVGEAAAPLALLGVPTVVSAPDPHAMLIEGRKQRAGRQIGELLGDVDDAWVCGRPPLSPELLKDDPADVRFFE